MKKYKEPRITISKCDCTCNHCNKPIKTGHEVYVIPKKAVYHVRCYKDAKTHEDLL